MFASSWSVARRLAALSLLFLVGCVGVPAEKLAPLDYQEVLAQERMPEVSYALHGLLDGMHQTTRTSRNRVEEIFRRSFAAAYLGSEGGLPAAPDPQRLHLDVYMRLSLDRPWITWLTGLVSIGTFGVVPIYSYQDIYLDVRVLRGGALQKQYVYLDGETAWYGWVLLPWAFSNDASDVEGQVLENMILHFISDLRRDLPQLVR